MKKKFLILIFALALAFSVSAGIGAAAIIRNKQYQARLREIYEGALLSALRKMEDMQLLLSKALLSEEEMAMRYLSQAGSGAAQVQRSLSLLPLSHTDLQSAVKFANQLSDYSAVLISAGQFSPQDILQMDQLLSACKAHALALGQAREEMTGRAVSGESDFYPGEDAPPAYDSGVSYPALIYDGPFSDAREKGTAKALGEKEITREEALQIARDFVGSERVLSLAPGADTGGDIPCFGVTLQLSDVTLEAAVSKKGGKILWMAPDTADFPLEKSVEECREAALVFLEEKGYGPMIPCHFQVYQGVAVLSFAPAQGETLLYPDLIKVQLRMDTARIVGMEARNYLMNHTARPLLSPLLSLEEAMGNISSRLHIEESRLCLIPSRGKEILCYEFRGDFQGQTYLVYINAENGRQEDLLQLVESAAGLETV